MSLQLSIIVPCYNEQEVIRETANRLVALLEQMVSASLITGNSAIYFVDDGSHDQTWSIIEGLSEQGKKMHGIKLSRNCGHQNAVLAGLFSAPGDALVSIDADLQDDISVIPDMVRKHQEGAEVVFGVRKTRPTDTAFKRHTAELYYRLLSIIGVDIIHNHADFRLLGRRAIECLATYSEVNLFLRGMIPLLGFPTDTVFYDRRERLAGQSKYPVRKMLSFAIDGITSFSVTPLRMISVLGFFICILSFIMIVWIVIGKLFMNSVIPGWASSIIAIYFLGGVQLLSVGILGEYVAKIYLEAKRRPRYFVEKTI